MLVVATTGAIPVGADHNYPDDVDGNVTTLRGPASVFGSLDEPAAVRSAREDGSLVESNVTVNDETVVGRFESPWLNRTVAETDGETTTERFFRAMNGTNASVGVVELNPTPQRRRFVVDLHESDTRVVHDTANGTFWLVVNTTNPVLRTEDGDPLPDRELYPGTELGLFVEIPTDDGSRTLTGRIRVVELDAEVTSLDGATRGDPLYVGNDGGVRLSATTTLLPDEPVTVVARAPYGTRLDGVETTTTAVNGSVTLDVELSLASLERGDAFTVTATACDRTVLDRRGVVGEPPSLGDVTATELANGSTRVIGTVRYPADGFVVLVDESDGSWVEHRAVPAGESTRVTFVVDAPRFARHDAATLVGWWDATGDGGFEGRGDGRDFRWVVDGDVLEETEAVDAAGSTATETFTPTPVVQETKTGGPTTSAKPVTAQPSPTGQPGFGLAGALVAFGTLSAMVARRP